VSSGHVFTSDTQCLNIQWRSYIQHYLLQCSRQTISPSFSNKCLYNPVFNTKTWWNRSRSFTGHESCSA